MKTLRVVQLHNCRDAVRNYVLFLFVCTVFLLVGCSEGDDPTPTPSDVSGAASALTDSTFAPTVQFVATNTPAATETLAPTPTPTPDPQTLITQAQHAAFLGDDGQAVNLYTQALQMLPNAKSDVALSARFAMGQSQLNVGDVTSALETFTALISDAVTSTIATDAHVMLGRSAASAGDNTTAISHYEAALTAQSVISPYLNEWLGDAYVAANQPVSAAVPYQMALNGASLLQQSLSLRETLALSQQLSGQYAAALEQYDAILAVSKIPAYRAHIVWQSVQVLQAMGQMNAAYQRMHDLVNNYPSTSVAFLALQELLKASQPVDELQRGIVDYYNGAYTAAQQVFKRAIADDSRTNEIRYWAALNYIELNSPADAYRNLNEIISTGPGAPRYGDALLEKGNLLADSGDLDNAAITYHVLATSAPSDPKAPFALQKLGLVYERAGKIEESAQTHLEAYMAYPQADGATESLLRSAIAQHRLGRYQETISETHLLLARFPASKEAPLAQLWLGKAQLAAGETVSGQATLSQLAQSRPDDYEGTRAAELVADSTRVPLSKSFGRIPAESIADNQATQAEAETWLRTRLNISSTVDIRSLRPAILADGRFVRGSELWRLGFKTEARTEFEALRAAYGKDALAMYQLALYFRDIGLYRSSVGAADTLLSLASAGTISETPIFLAKLVYPIYYPELIAQESDEFALDPFLVAGLIRQESLFEPFAASGASAYGLMQVVPGTGQEINGALGWPPNYSERDLTRPYVSIRFGTWYLARQRDAMKGDLYAALAAYNGGPGMGLRWKDRSGGDPDVFFMTMPLDGAGYRETQLYIRTVTTNYAIYHRLYGGD